MQVYHPTKATQGKRTNGCKVKLIDTEAYLSNVTERFEQRFHFFLSTRECQVANKESSSLQYRISRYVLGGSR